MTLYYGIVFGLLCFEVAMFMMLILPLPFAWRRGLFKFLANNPSECEREGSSSGGGSSDVVSYKLRILDDVRLTFSPSPSPIPSSPSTTLAHLQSWPRSNMVSKSPSSS